MSIFTTLRTVFVAIRGFFNRHDWLIVQVLHGNCNMVLKGKRLGCHLREREVGDISSSEGPADAHVQTIIVFFRNCAIGLGLRILDAIPDE